MPLVGGVGWLGYGEGGGLLGGELDAGPGEAVDVEVGHECVGVVLFHVPDAGLFPITNEHLLGSDHGGNAGGVTDGLAADFFEALLVIADVVDVDGLLFAVLDAGDHVADAGAAFGRDAEVAGVREDGFEELKRDDFLALVFDFVDAGHADVLKHFEVLEVVRREAHPELRALDRRDVLGEGFEFLVIHPVDFVTADAFGAGEALVLGHRGSLDELAVFPVAALGGDFADVDLRVEVGGEGVAVVAAVDVDDVERVDLVEVVLERPGGENIGDAGVKTGAEQRGEAGFFETFLVFPLPRVFELGDVLGLVVGGVEVIDAGFKAGVHEGEVLVRQGDVDQQGGSRFTDELGSFCGVVGIDLKGGDVASEALFDRGGDGLALRDGAGGEGDLAEDFGEHGAFVGDDAADSAGSDDEDLVHVGGREAAIGRFRQDYCATVSGGFWGFGVNFGSVAEKSPSLQRKMGHLVEFRDNF